MTIKEDTDKPDRPGGVAYRPSTLVADLGGTNIRFALSDLDELTISNYALLKNDLFASPIEALEAYLASTTERPEHVGFAVAGPIEGDTARLNNREWTITAQQVRQVTGARNVRFINDFEAIALSLPHLEAADMVDLGGGSSPVRGGAMAVLGPGTGLGVAGLLRHPKGDVAIAGEGGHVAFAGQTAEDLDLMRSLRTESGFVSANELISGPGLERLYELLAEQANKKVSTLTAPEIVAAANNEADPIAVHALGLFGDWLGRFAGDVALTIGARGGVFIGGGIAPKILSTLKTDRFRKAFEDKGDFAAYLTRIPLHVITTPNAGLKGAALAVSEMVTRPGWR